MTTQAPPFAGLPAGTALGPVTYTVSRAANERYWHSAAVDHPLLRAGALYPPLAANLTVLLFQRAVPEPLLHTAQRLVCHRRASAGVTLTVTGVLAQRFEKRGREYAVVEAEIALPDGSPLWTSTATFLEHAR
jgi:acyl-coenzyme A synthetase/AMP-(fatty) acid ligase